MTAFYQAFKNQKGNTIKQTYELWRQKVGEHRSYIDANKLANVRRDIMKKNRLTAVKMKISQPINTEQQNTEDARVRLENLTLEQVENTIEFEGNETFVVENKEAIEEIKIEILEDFFKTHNINIEE